MHILSVNSGSSSLKISLYGLSEPSKQPSLILESQIDNISAPPALFTFKSKASKAESVKDQKQDDITDHASAFDYFLHFSQKEAGIRREDISHICHRVVHGGDYLDPVLIKKDTYHHIETLSDLAPLCAF